MGVTVYNFIQPKESQTRPKNGIYFDDYDVYGYCLSLKSYFHIKGCRLLDYKAEALSRKKICISAVQTCKQASVSNSILWKISDVLLLQCSFFKPFHITYKYGVHQASVSNSLFSAPSLWTFHVEAL